MTDIERLKAIIASKGLRNSWIAEQLGLTHQGFMLKLNGSTEWKQSEISKLSNILGLKMSEVKEIFLNNM